MAGNAPRCRLFSFSVTGYLYSSVRSADSAQLSLGGSRSPHRLLTTHHAPLTNYPVLIQGIPGATGTR